MAMTLRDLKAIGWSRRWMRDPFRAIFWKLGKRYFRALLQSEEEKETAIRALSNRLALLEELVAENLRSESSKEHQPPGAHEPRMTNGVRR
jgi:hypothetical protein